MSDRLRHHFRGAAWQVLLLSLPLIAMSVFYFVTKGELPFTEDLKPIWKLMTWHPWLCDAVLFTIAGCFTLWNLVALFAAVAAGSGAAILGMLSRLGATYALLWMPLAIALAPLTAAFVLLVVSRPAKRKSPAT